MKYRQLLEEKLPEDDGQVDLSPAVLKSEFKEIVKSEGINSLIKHKTDIGRAKEDVKKV